MKINIIILNLFFLTNSFISYSFDTDSVKIITDDSVKNVITVWKVSEISENNYFNIDTSINIFQIYNPVYQNSISNVYLGSIGLPCKSVVFFESDYLSEFSFLNSYKAYLFMPENVVYYNVNKPYTNLFYSTGPNKEQTLNLIHTQNVNKYLNFGIKYYSISTEGHLARQITKNNGINIFTSYNSLRYSLHVSYNRNKIKIHENGGIIDDTYLTDSLILNERINNPDQIPVFLENAESYLINKNFNFVHKYRLGKKIATINSDSTKTETFNYKIGIIHKFNFRRDSRLYTDEPDTLNFYQNNYNYTSTYDSIFYQNLEHSLIIEYNDFKLGNNNLCSWIGMSTEQKQYKYFNKDTLFNNFKDTILYNIISKGNISANIQDKYDINLSGKLYLAGYNADDFQVRLSIKRFFNGKKDTSFFTFSSEYNIKSYDFFITNFSSNHFKWNNNFNNTPRNETIIKLLYERPLWDIKLGINLASIDNYVFFSRDAIPTLNDSTINILSGYINKNFHAGNFHFINKIIYQYSDNKSNIDLPEIVIYNSTYFNRDIKFKLTGGLIKFQIGFDVFYNTEYYAPAYMPATGQFYVQNEKLIGDYPFVDVFINLKIKRARLFFKMEHINEGILEKEYFTSLHYPVNERAFKFGVSWGFYD
ncbi:MAG: putative porin [Bacteroidales bacterium]|nr:putative porin [Bacteroidales bacterium]